MPTHLIGAYWGPRAASAENCTVQLTQWASALAGSGVTGLDAWLLRRPRGVAAFSAGQLLAKPEQLLRPMKNEVTRAVMPEFGWSVGLYTAQGGDLASECSARLGSVLPGASNSLVMMVRTASMPPPDTLIGLMHKAVVLFGADHAVVMDWDHRDPADERPVWQQTALAAYPGS